MTDIDPTVARENARHSTGRFGAQAHTIPEVKLGVPTLTEARQLMGTLHPGVSVIFTVDGRDHPCVVQRREEGFGHPDSKSVTIGYGPGRWNQEVNAAGLAAGNYRVRVETNMQRLQREAEITDPTHPDYNSDLDIIIPATTKTYRELIRSGIDPNDTDARDAFVQREVDKRIYGGDLY